jgi:hypothetical protein
LFTSKEKEFFKDCVEFAQSGVLNVQKYPNNICMFAIATACGHLHALKQLSRCTLLRSMNWWFLLLLSIQHSHFKCMNYLLEIKEENWCLPTNTIREVALYSNQEFIAQYVDQVTTYDLYEMLSLLHGTGRSKIAHWLENYLIIRSTFE